MTDHGENCHSLLEAILSGMSTSSVLGLIFEDSLYTQAIRSAGLTGGYGRWVDKQIQAKIKSGGKVNLGFVTSTINLVKRFLEVQKGLKGNKDINSYKTVDALQRAIHTVNPVAIQDPILKKNPGLKVVFHGGEWEVFKVSDYSSLCAIGSRSAWCVVASEWNYERYLERGATLYLVRRIDGPWTDDDSRFLIAIFPRGEDLEIADAGDEQIDVHGLASYLGDDARGVLHAVGLSSYTSGSEASHPGGEDSLLDSLHITIDELKDVLSSAEYDPGTDFRGGGSRIDITDHISTGTVGKILRGIPDLMVSFAYGEGVHGKGDSNVYLGDDEYAVLTYAGSVSSREKGILRNLGLLDGVGGGWPDDLRRVMVTKGIFTPTHKGNQTRYPNGLVSLQREWAAKRVEGARQRFIQRLNGTLEYGMATFIIRELLPIYMKDRPRLLSVQPVGIPSPVPIIKYLFMRRFWGIFGKLLGYKRDDYLSRLRHPLSVAIHFHPGRPAGGEVWELVAGMIRNPGGLFEFQVEFPNHIALVDEELRKRGYEVKVG